MTISLEPLNQHSILTKTNLSNGEIVKLKNGAGKWFLIALLSGTISGAMCLFLGLVPPISNAVPMGVSAGVLYGFRERWLA